MANDVAAWYEKYGPMVFRRCRKILRNEEEAKDAVQDVFIKLLKARKENVTCLFSSYLYTSATRICLNRIRARNEYEGLAKDFEDFPGRDDSFEQIDAELLAEAILQDDAEDNRTICYMRFFDGMTLEEIGENVGLSRTAIEKRLAVFKNRVLLKWERDNT
jgi:RNA polymerase sigma-70 factor (ECF subfamily)